MNTNDIIILIKTIRKNRLLTQKEMSEKLNISQTQYNFYESGKSEMTITTFLKILEILNITINDFFQFEKIITKDELTNIQNCIEKLKSKLS